MPEAACLLLAVIGQLQTTANTAVEQQKSEHLDNASKHDDETADSRISHTMSRTETIAQLSARVVNNRPAAALSLHKHVRFD